MIDYKKVIIQWKEFEMPAFLPRLADLNTELDFIVTITGPRRAGKTYFCFQSIDLLLKKGIPKENILYINFEDEKLLGAEAKDLELLMDAFYELFTISKNHKIYLFLDEIQNVKNWDVWVRRIYDTQKKMQLVLTGSSSKLLSSEISTKLRGRVLNKEIFPLSFKEFLAWKNVDYSLKTISSSKERFEVKKHFADFLINGSYPSIITQNVPKEGVLQVYYESMILRDIVERHNVKEVKKLKVLASLLFESVSKEISYNNLANKLKSLGFNISKNTIIDYLSHFEEAYLFFQNLRYEYSIIKQLGSIKKLYCIDNGLLNAVSFKFSEDKGKLMENLVFVELKRRGKKIYYHKDKFECDFVIHEKNKVIAALQVTNVLNEDNTAREMNGLLEAMEKHALNEGIVLTHDQKDTKIAGNKTIKVTPIWEWLLLDNSHLSALESKG